MESNSKICEHCGATGAGMFANDASRVCERCYAYDRVVAGELRASQHDLGLLASGDATVVEGTTAKAWHQEFGMSFVLSLCAAALFAFAAYDQNALAYAVGGLVTLMAILLAVQAVRTKRFAKAELPKIVDRASHPPRAMQTRTTA